METEREYKTNYCQSCRNLRYDSELKRVRNKNKCTWCIAATKRAKEARKKLK